MNLETLIALPRNIKKICFLIHDFLMIFTAFWFTQSLKADYSDEWFDFANWQSFLLTALLTITLFIRMGLYRAVTRFVSFHVLTTAFAGSLASAVLFFLNTLIFEERLRLALPIVYFLLLFVSVTGSRMVLRGLLSDHQKKTHDPVIIYGAGRSGRQLLEAVKQMREYSAAAFVDDNPKLWHTVIYDLAVYQPDAIAFLIERYGVEKILLAIPSATQEQRRRIISKLKAYPCEVLTIPGMKDLMDGKISIGTLKKISVSDLLGRDSVAPDDRLMNADTEGKTVMVTGAGGSIGSELCRQIIRRRPERLLLFELSEFALYTVEKELCEYCARNGHRRRNPSLFGFGAKPHAAHAHYDRLFRYDRLSRRRLQTRPYGRVQHRRGHTQQHLRHTRMRACRHGFGRGNLRPHLHRQSRPPRQHDGCGQTHGGTLPSGTRRRTRTKNPLQHGTFRQCFRLVRLRRPAV